ncbi:MAG: hypothetical protein IPG02_09340 [Ignavibacteria bacterium]|nr:hypothetical protein [Ignavibacteria bacterium]
MKFVYTAAYILSGLLFLTALLGGGLMRPTIDSLSEKTIEKAGFRKEYVESADKRIDDLIYKSKQIELQIEKIKNFFSSDKIDETKFARENNDMIKRAVYDPFVKAVNYVYRMMFGFAGLIFLCFGIVFQIADSSMTLRRRVKRLEEIVAARSG